MEGWVVGSADAEFGWVEEIPGVNSRATTRRRLLANLRDALQEAIDLNRADAREAASGPYEEVNLTH